MRYLSPRVLALPLLAAGLALPALARADGPFDLHDSRTGVQAAAFVGVGGFSNGALFDAHNTGAQGATDPMVGLQAEVGYRFIPLLSAGLHGTLQFLTYDRDRAHLTSATTGWANAGALGAYLRVHPLALIHSSRDDLLSRFDLHAAIGFDFLATVAGGTHTQGGGAYLDTRVATAGVAMPVSVGLDFYLTSSLAVGILGQWSYWTAASACASTNTSIGSAGDLCTHDLGPESYLFLGAGVRGTFNVLH